MPQKNAQRVRIIGGRHRGRVLRFPDAPGLRPTPDRVRETLFNWLGQDLTGRRTLDLYAGSGVLSLEALSRGASLAVAVDRNAALIRAIAATAAAFGASGLETHVADAGAHLAQERRDFDVIFLDPPFDSDPWPALSAAVRGAPCAGRFRLCRGRARARPAGAALCAPPRARRAGALSSSAGCGGLIAAAGPPC